MARLHATCTEHRAGEGISTCTRSLVTSDLIFSAGCHIIISIVHPRSYSTAPNPSCKPEAAAAHGEVADQIPDQCHELNSCKEDRQDRRMQLG